MSSSTAFEIELKGAGKKFFRNWIFRGLSASILPHQKVVVLGQNGSGKSTLLQMLSGYESLSEGTLRFSKGEVEIPRENVFRHVVLAAPYLELPEEFSLNEIIHFHFRFKKPLQNLSVEDVLAISQLESSREKTFKYFSSGMKQRAKLVLAMLSESDLLLLDEPLSNLDKDGERWYRGLAEKYLEDRMVVVCSNQNESEYFFCTRNINIAEYK